MAITNGWGQAHVNNTIGFGQGASNSSNGYGSIYDYSWSGDTNIIGISQQAIEWEALVVSDSGTVESLFCVSQSLKK